jgi:hypothetical protein
MLLEECVDIFLHIRVHWSHRKAADVFNYKYPRRNPTYTRVQPKVSGLAAWS